MNVRLTVTCDRGHVMGMWHDRIEEKYPFWCETCDEDKRTGSYPWVLTAEIVADDDEPA